MMQFGDPTKFGFDLTWAGAPNGTAADATRGQLRLWIDSHSVWGGPGGLEWTWVDLVEHMARFWTCLVVEEMDPIGLGDPAEELRRRADARWASTSEAERDEEEEALFAYLEAHDLAAGLGGVFPAAVFVTRQGVTARVASRGYVARLPFADAERALVEVGNAIVDRLATLDDERARSVAVAWRSRENVSASSAAATAAGLTEAEVVELFAGVAPELAHASLAQVRVPNELLAVARMTVGALPSREVAALLNEISKQSHVWTQPIDDLAAEIAADLSRFDDARPWAQGYEVAEGVRLRLGMSDETRIDPGAMLAEWNIPVRDIEISSRLIDALCVWGPKLGPAIQVNRKGLHGRMNGRRATLAHEIAHLLMDRQAGLPVAEVLGGRVPRELERRAKAFAAELLIPRSVAYERILAASDLREEIAALSGHYGASREIVAWQARNGATSPLPPDVRAFLRDLVSTRSNF